MLHAGGLRFEQANDPEFLHRLIYAGGKQFGRCQKLIRLAIEDALASSRDDVKIEDFASALRRRTLCDSDPQQLFWLHASS